MWAYPYVEKWGLPSLRLSLQLCCSLILFVVGNTRFKIHRLHRLDSRRGRERGKGEWNHAREYLWDDPVWPPPDAVRSAVWKSGGRPLWDWGDNCVGDKMWLSLPQLSQFGAFEVTSAMTTVNSHVCILPFAPQSFHSFSHSNKFYSLYRVNHRLIDYLLSTHLWNVLPSGGLLLQLSCCPVG